MAAGDKDPGAFRTIGELSDELGVAQHVLRYWETRFPQLKPLQRAGNRRYYRPADVALCQRIHHLLSVEGYTVKGVQKLLRDNGSTRQTSAAAPSTSSMAHSAQVQSDPPGQSGIYPESAMEEATSGPPEMIGLKPLASTVDYERLVEIRDRLVAALSS